MLTKPLLLAVFVACGVHPIEAEPPAEQPDREPPDTSEEDGQHFCCESLGTGTGNGCVTIDKAHVNLCDKLLYCAGSYMKDGGKVTCLD